MEEDFPRVSFFSTTEATETIRWTPDKFPEGTSWFLLLQQSKQWRRTHDSPSLHDVHTVYSHCMYICGRKSCVLATLKVHYWLWYRTSLSIYTYCTFWQPRGHWQCLSVSFSCRYEYKQQMTRHVYRQPFPPCRQRHGEPSKKSIKYLLSILLRDNLYVMIEKELMNENKICFIFSFSGFRNCAAQMWFQSNCSPGPWSWHSNKISQRSLFARDG